MLEAPRFFCYRLNSKILFQDRLDYPRGGMCQIRVYVKKMLAATVTTMVIEPPTYSVLIVISRFETLKRIFRFTGIYNVGSMFPRGTDLTTVFKKKERVLEETDDLGRYSALFRCKLYVISRLVPFT